MAQYLCWRATIGFERGKNTIRANQSARSVSATPHVYQPYDVVFSFAGRVSLFNIATERTDRPRAFVRSFVRSCIRLFIRSFVRSFVRSCTHSFVRLFLRSFVSSFVRNCFSWEHLAPRYDTQEQVPSPPYVNMCM